jgi:hypothetical protein
MSWKQSDSVRLREYLNLNNFSLLAELKNSTPILVIDGNSSVEGISLSAARKQGWEDAVAFLQSLADQPHRLDNPEAGSFTTM